MFLEIFGQGFCRENLENTPTEFTPPIFVSALALLLAVVLISQDFDAMLRCLGANHNIRGFGGLCVGNWTSPRLRAGSAPQKDLPKPEQERLVLCQVFRCCR